MAGMAFLLLWKCLVKNSPGEDISTFKLGHPVSNDIRISGQEFLETSYLAYFHHLCCFFNLWNSFVLGI